MSNPTQRSRQAIDALGEHTPQEAAAVYATLAVYEQLALLTAQLRELNRSIDNGLTIFANPTELTTTTADELNDPVRCPLCDVPVNQPAPAVRCDAALICPDTDDIPCVLQADHTGLHMSTGNGVQWADR